MALWRIKGKANYAGACGKSFDVTVESFEDISVGSWKKEKAILAKYPDWTGICCFSWEKL